MATFCMCFFFWFVLLKFFVSTCLRFARLFKPSLSSCVLRVSNKPLCLPFVNNDLSHNIRFSVLKLGVKIHTFLSFGLRTMLRGSRMNVVDLVSRWRQKLTSASIGELLCITSFSVLSGHFFSLYLFKQLKCYNVVIISLYHFQIPLHNIWNMIMIG